MLNTRLARSPTCLWRLPMFPSKNKCIFLRKPHRHYIFNDWYLNLRQDFWKIIFILISLCLLYHTRHVHNIPYFPNKAVKIWMKRNTNFGLNPCTVPSPNNSVDVKHVKFPQSIKVTPTYQCSNVNYQLKRPVKTPYSYKLSMFYS